MCIRPGGEEVLSPGRSVMDVCVSNAHCKKVVFTFLPFTFYLSQYHSVTLIHNILYRSIFNQCVGVPFFIDSFFCGYLIQKTSIIATLMLYRCIF